MVQLIWFFFIGFMAQAEKQPSAQQPIKKPLSKKQALSPDQETKGIEESLSEKQALKAKNRPLKEYLWEADNITVQFSCDKNNKLKVALFDPAQPDMAQGSLAIIRMSAGNVPPSGKGYKKFIYASRFLKKAKKLYIRKERTKDFMSELELLRRQTFKNKEVAGKEYDEKIKYCGQLPKKQRDKCYSSSSGYQPAEPVIILWIVAEGQKKPPGYAKFDPQKLENLKKLSCYKK